MSEDNIVELGCITRLDVPAEKILRKALDKDLESVVVVGVTKDGDEFFASSMPDGGEAIYWLQRGIWKLNKMADQIDEEGLPA